jgi:carbonic anhydrase/acetyltransferase-like protein (isoleucine patch superfamily)
MMSIRPFETAEPRLGARVYVDPAASVIGRVSLGDDASVWPAAVVRGDVHEIRIGARCNIQDGSVLHVTHDGPYQPGGFGLTLADDVTVGHRVTLHGCTVGNLCLIGMGATVMDGAVLEDEVLLAAGSLVTPGTRVSGARLWRGAPARAVRDLTGEEREMLRYSSAHYMKLKDRYRGMGDGGDF